MSEQQALHSWSLSLLFFAVKTAMALTEEERRSVEEEKQLFLNEIGLDEDSLMDMFKHFIAFVLRDAFASTDEERQSVEEERSLFFKGNENYKTALDKYVRKKNQNSIPPAA